MSTILPALLPIPLDVAAGIQFSGNGEFAGTLTSRDLAWAFCAMYVAQGVEQNKQGFWPINGNDLRAAVGQTRRQRTAVEQARWNRLGATLTLIGRDIYSTPSATGGTYLGDQLWKIEPELVDRWRVYEQTDIVGLPLRLLQLAKSKTTIVMALRALAWRLGAAPAGSILRGDDNSLSVRLSLQQVRDELGLPLSIETKAMLRDHLKPASEELEQLAVDIGVMVEPVWTLKFPQPVARRKQQILAFDLHINWNNAALTPAPTKSLRVRGRHWRRESARSRPAPPPLLDRVDENVVPFSGPGFMHVRPRRPEGVR